MSLKIKCTQCEKSYRVEDTWAGKRVRCTACGAIMVAPMPVRPPPLPTAQNSSWDAIAGVDDSDFPPLEFSPTPPPPLVPYSSERVSPYVMLPNEQAIDRWVPWAAVAILILLIFIQVSAVVSKLSGRVSTNNPTILVTIVGYVVGGFFVALVLPAAAGALMMLGVFTGSRILSFDNRPLLYWRCIAAACAYFATTTFLSLIGLEIAAVRIFLALIIGGSVLWLMIRLRLPQFALAGGLALIIGILLPVGVFVGLGAALKSLAASPRLITRTATIRPVTPIPGFTSSLNTRASLRQKSAAHLREINQALVLYAMDHQNTGPTTLNVLVTEEHLPADDLNAPGGQGYHFAGYFPQTTGNAIVAYEESSRAQLGGVTILFQDGNIQFFEGNSADSLLHIPAGQPVVQQPIFQFPPHQMPGIHPSAPHFRMPDAPQAADPTQLLQRIATAYQTYFAAHDSTYPRVPGDLVAAGILKTEDIQPGGFNQLRPTMMLPNVQNLPADVIVIYVLDPMQHHYTVLFGDWHIESMDHAGYFDAFRKSSQSLATLRQRH